MRCLDGITVLDLTRRYPGAFTGMYLADFGAEVIKVDPPGPSLLQVIQGTSEERFAAYNAVDRNKRSLVLDLKKEAAREVFYRLAKRADVVLEGFRPGVTDRLGIGYQRLSELNPRLIYCALSGFGQTGPDVNVPAHDMNYIGIGGALSLIGQRNGQPYFPSNLIADYAGAAMHGIVGILLALLARDRTGKGQFIDIAYLDTVVSLLAPAASEYFESGKVPKRGETRLTGGAPWAQVFRCKDGEYFTIGAVEPHLWANLCRALGREDFIAEHGATGERVDQIHAELAAIFATRTRDGWYQYLKDKEACVGPVYTLDETFQDPQVIHRRMVVDVEHPTLGAVKQAGIAIKLSDTPGEIRHAGVSTGTDTEALLGELGYGEADVAALRQVGAIG